MLGTKCLNSLLQEACLGGSLQHPHIVRQLGVTGMVWQGQACVGGLVQEFLPGGDLWSSLM